MKPAPSIVWHIGDVLRKVREFRELSRKQVAGLAKTTNKTVGKLEHGAPNYERRTLEKVAAVLDVPIGFLEAQVPEVPNPARVTLAPDERAILDDYRQLTEQEQAQVRSVLRSFAVASDIRKRTRDSASDTSATGGTLG